MLFDSHGRIISYLRISVTDRCNFRCVYCMPADGVALVSKQALLSFEEITRVARVGAGLGLVKVRLTGGEPTVRAELPKLVAMLAAIEGIDQIAMTTNAARLEELAGPLKRAGLGRVNISLDTLDAGRAAEIARRDVLPAVLRGIDAAVSARLGPLKFNTVVMRGVNDRELTDLVDFARERNAQIRFIEYMPMGNARFDGHNRTVTANEMLRTLRNRFDLAPEQPGEAHGSDPARGNLPQFFYADAVGLRIQAVELFLRDKIFCERATRAFGQHGYFRAQFVAGREIVFWSAIFVAAFVFSDHSGDAVAFVEKLCTRE